MLDRAGLIVLSMPEGPEVRRITEKLRARVHGRSLLWLEMGPLDPASKYQQVNQIWTQIANGFPSTCLDIICKGKQLFFFFENGLAFISGLGEEGHWYYFDLREPDGHDRLQSYMSNKNYKRFGLFFGKLTGKGQLAVSDTQIWYDDMISHGNFTVTNWATAIEKMKTIGPDLLASSVPFANVHPVLQKILPQDFNRPVPIQQFVDSIRSPRRGNMEICKFLMKQEYCSGIGNYLKSEILYRSRIHPFRKLSTLSDSEIVTLHSVSLSTIREAYQCGGLTHGTFLDPDMEKGSFPIYIYKRAGQLDPFGNPILFVSKKDSPDGRGTYFVPEVQR